MKIFIHKGIASFEQCLLYGLRIKIIFILKVYLTGHKAVGFPDLSLLFFLIAFSNSM